MGETISNVQTRPQDPLKVGSIGGLVNNSIDTGRQWAPEDLESQIVTEDEVASSPATSLVFRPGETPSAANVFVDWAVLMDAADGIQGSKIILLDDTLVSPLVIPAGTYDMRDVTLRGIAHKGTFASPLVAGSVVSLADGVVFQDLNYLEHHISLIGNNSTGPVFVYPTAVALGDRGFVRFREYVFVGNNGSYAMFELDVPIFLMDLVQISQLATGAGTEIVDVNNKVLIIQIFPGSFTPDDVVKGVGTFLPQVFTGAGSIGSTQTNFSGVTSTNLADLSREHRYQPTTVGDWSGVDPVTVRAALDRIAAAIGPIA